MNFRRRDSTQLFSLGFLSLFLQLLLIRYLAGSIWNLGYFPNLVLIGSLIGIGTGLLLHRRFSDSTSEAIYSAAAPALLCFVALVVFASPSLPGFSGRSGDFGGDLYFTSVTDGPVSTRYALFAIWFSGIIVLFFMISQRTAKVFGRFAPLRAYALDLWGSCAGVIVFMGLSWFQTSPWLWFLAVIPPFWAAMGPAPRARLAIALVSVLATAAMTAYQDTQLQLTFEHRLTGHHTTRWSPYQKTEYFDSPGLPHKIRVNGIIHQNMMGADELARSFYVAPYRLGSSRSAPTPIRSVLVLGAGSGNDVAAALLSGVERVDAIEIDPVLVGIGSKVHPARPYSDPRVFTTIDDGRAFMTRTRMKYDLIVFALTDSLIKVSPMGQLRLENYLFTEQAVRRAFHLLNSDGRLAFYNYYREPWLIEKIESMISQATGKRTERILENRDFAMITVSQSGPAAEPHVANLAVPTDDWPFLYLRKRGMPAPYLGGMAWIVCMSLMLLMLIPRPRVDHAGKFSRFAYLLMGLAFMLLESKSIIQFSLLFGVTWINSSLVFLAILLSILLATWVAGRLTVIRPGPVYALLVLSTSSSIFFPLANLLQIESTAIRLLAASLMTFSPLFFANLIFCERFRDQPDCEHFFGWNLIGATLGGAAEYLSMVFGYTALAWVVIACYTVVFGIYIVTSRHADRKSRARLSPCSTK